MPNEREKERQERYIRDLLEELDRMEAVGKDDRVAAIRAELGKKASEGRSPAQRAEKRPAASRSEER